MSELKQRYISKELVHFVGRGMSDDQQFDLLIKILNEGWITHLPHNPNISGNLTVRRKASISKNEMYAPEITCFADIPIQDLSLHITKYSPVGISFTKNLIAEAGGVPVHYIPKTANVRRSKKFDAGGYMKMLQANGHANAVEQWDEDISKAQYFDESLDEYHKVFEKLRKQRIMMDLSPDVSELFNHLIDLERFFDFHIFSYFKFFDHKLSDEDPDNYYFEREWRIVGNLKFNLSDVKTVFFPRKYAESFRSKCPQFYGQVIFTD